MAASPTLLLAYAAPLALIWTWYVGRTRRRERRSIAVREQEYDVIYVNGSNNLPNLWQHGDHWKVRLIEEDFHRLMWEGVE